jgi:hypothetical protein
MTCFDPPPKIWRGAGGEDWYMNQLNLHTDSGLKPTVGGRYSYLVDVLAVVVKNFLSVPLSLCVTLFALMECIA